MWTKAWDMLISGPVRTNVIKQLNVGTDVGMSFHRFVWFKLLTLLGFYLIYPKIDVLSVTILCFAVEFLEGVSPRAGPR